MRRRPDSWFWLPENKGDFFVRSCYRILRGEFECQEGQFWKRLWGLKLPGKVSIFLWRVGRGVLPTAVELVKKRVSILPQCTWCHS